MSGPADTTVRAAGAVLWRAAPSGELQVALVHRPKYDDWSLPKGKVDRGEHVLVTAVREVHEETGHRVALNHPLPTQHYLVEGRPKEVRYWAARTEDDGSFSPTREIDEVRWLPIGDATRMLTHPRDADLVTTFAGAPVRTVPLLLVRHAPSVSRSSWRGEDTERPLDAAGEAAARALADLLGAYGVRRLLSSDTRRCVDTFAPYADRHGLRVEELPSFSEHGYAADPSVAVDQAVALLGAPEPTALCSHRPVLPEVAAALCRRSGIDPPARGLAAGAFWVLHVADGRVVAVEEHAPTPG